MQDSIPPSAPRSVLGRLRDLWDREAAKADGKAAKAANARRALIPEFELYEPQPPSPPSMWEKVKSIGSEDVQFVAFLVMVCMAVPLVLIVVLTLVANDMRFPSWLFTVVIILAVGTALSFAIAYLDQLFGDGSG